MGSVVRLARIDVNAAGVIGYDRLTMPTMLKKDADAYDRMLDAAARLATLIESGGIEIDEADLEELTIFLAEHGMVVGSILRNLKYCWS